MSGPGALRFFLAPIFLWIFSLVTGSMIWFGWLFPMISSIAACWWGNSFFRCSWKRSYYLRTMYLYYYYYVFCIEEICSYLSYFIMYLIVHSLKLLRLDLWKPLEVRPKTRNWKNVKKLSRVKILGIVPFSRQTTQFC